MTRISRERLERARESWRFDVLESLYWAALAKLYWRLLHGDPDAAERSPRSEGSP